jgi:cell wall-active antibiotic response 4TMS protein YvqF
MGMPPSVPRHERSLTGPIVLIALGIMFLLQEFVPHWGLHKTWPVLLILIGAAKLLEIAQARRPPQGPGTR